MPFVSPWIPASAGMTGVSLCDGYFCAGKMPATRGRGWSGLEEELGELLEGVEEGGIAGCELGAVVVAYGEQDALEAQGGGDVEVVDGVADKEDALRRVGQLGEELSAGVEFGVGVDVVEAFDVGEEVSELEVVDGVVEFLLVVGGEDGLGEACVLAGLEGVGGVVVESALGQSGDVAAVVLFGEVGEGGVVEVEADVAVELDDGEGEGLAVAGDGEWG